VQLIISSRSLLLNVALFSYLLYIVAFADRYFNLLHRSASVLHCTALNKLDLPFACRVFCTRKVENR